MPSPTTTRGLLGLFPQGAELPATDPGATTLPVRLPKSSSLWVILAAGAWGKSARGGASVHKGPQEEGRGGTGEGAESEGWSGGSDKALYAEMEEDGMPAGELGGSNNTMTASPWGMQESGAGGLRVDARAGRSNERKAPTATADKAGTQGRHGARQGQGENMEARGNLRGQNNQEWGETMGAARPL